MNDTPRPRSKRSLEDARLPELIRTSFSSRDSTYGAARVARDLRDWGDPLMEVPTT